MHNERIFIPGPTPVPPPLTQAMMAPMMNHRGLAMDALTRDIMIGLRDLWHTKGSVVILPASGTGGLEALIQNTLTPPDRVLAATVGAFGDRFGQIAERLGLTVDWLRVRWGDALDADALVQALEQKAYQAVLLTHNETSTGVLNPIKEIADRIRGRVPLVLVDSVSGFPSVPLELESWGVDAAVVGSQKGFMLPPGLAMVGIADGARAKFHGQPGLYFDFGPYLKGQWPYTPALSLLYGLKASLDCLRAEKEGDRFARHRTMAVMVQQGASSIGFKMAAHPAFASPTVTALIPPEGLAAKAILAECRNFGIALAGGQGEFRDRIVRVGHVGATAPLDIVGALAVLDMAVANLAGVQSRGQAASMAVQVWHEREIVTGGNRQNG